MKNFTLGVLVMLSMGLIIQNQHLHNQITRINKSSNQTERVAQKVSRKSTVVAVQERPANYNQYNGTPPASDPRCPSHLPYFDGRWGCVVKRP